ncbi:hypothetical protein OC716_01475 [Candidatus Phytoplasma aurantifolia]|uniref:Uncharacterized protein n=1 Tax=Candidatus Phytoplasma citri TaxID=180978 RepID=A0ABU8ZT52_9MOLU|nr:hypothetical protein [Candidatus Phytoplasma aurantifolia]MDO8078924.1 hypothetical protein [Candidatus Phytoplasma aurantifolia]
MINILLDKLDVEFNSRQHIDQLKDSEIPGYLKHIIAPYQISYHTF